jgi:HK97 family phage prohead protease
MTMPKDVADLPLIGRAAEVMPETIDREARTIDVVWTTGATVQRARWEGWDDRIEYDEELEVSDEAVRMDRLNAGAPFLNSHYAYDLTSVLGSVVPGSARIEKGLGHAKVRLTDAPDAAGLVSRILDKSVRHVSVGYRVHRYEITKTDGQREKWRAVDWEPMEISAVAMPADPGAHIRSLNATEGAYFACVLSRQDDNAAAAAHRKGPNMTNDTPAGATTDAARNTPAPAVQAPAPGPDLVAAERERSTGILDLCTRHGMADLAADMIRTNVTLDAARAAILDKLAASDSAAAARSQPVLGRGQDETETRRRGMEDALVAGLTRTNVSEVGRPYMGRALIELAAERLEERRVPMGFGDREELLRRAFHTTSDFPFIFENALQRSLAMRYQSQKPTYRDIARRRTYMDFRDHTTVRPGDFPTLQPVSPEAGELKNGTFSESKEKTAVTAYGITVHLSRAMLVNDTLDAIGDVLSDQGMAVARFEDATFYAMALGGSNGDGPTLLETSRQMFNTTDATKAGTAAAITVDTLKLGRAAIRKRKSKDGADLELNPLILLVGPDKQTEAEQIVAPIQALEAGKVNPFAGMLRVVTTAKITGNAWYLFCGPDVAPNFEYGFLQGYEAPRFRVENMFGRQGTSLSLEHDFGCGGIDFRGGWKNAGA